jgi:hypothetical protein
MRVHCPPANRHASKTTPRGYPAKTRINPMPRELLPVRNRCGLRVATLTQTGRGLCSAAIVPALTNARSGFGIKGLAHGATDC